jgi:tripartite-type tricarboxylate transporter receptor subunit TctC
MSELIGQPIVVENKPAVADPVVRQKVTEAGAELLQSSPEEMADHMRKETAKWAEVIRAANIQLD